MSESHPIHKAELFDDTVCELGEGPIWHPDRQEFYWFDIINKKLFAKGKTGAKKWSFDEYVSALGLIDKDHFILASETGLWKFNVETGHKDLICSLEADNKITRSNDGRADPWGGFWIGTMGINAEENAGAIYRWFRGELRKIASDITISNGICFNKNDNLAYFADTKAQLVWSVDVDPETGWPCSEAGIFIDERNTDINIDGAITDKDGNYLAAIWGKGAIYKYNSSGQLIDKYECDTPQATCPAFGGPDGQSLFVTTASAGLEISDSGQPIHGATYVFQGYTKGMLEPKVIIA